MIYPPRRRSLACSPTYAKGWREWLPSPTFGPYLNLFEQLESSMLKPIALLPWEKESYASLDWIPQAVRFKLDAVGAKVGLKQWQDLDLGHRKELLALPAESIAEKATWLEKLQAIVALDKAGSLQTLPPAGPRTFRTEIQEQWKVAGVNVTLENWTKWTEFERFLAEKTAFSKSAQIPLKEIAPHLGLVAV
jgi:hypothetical protein